MTTRKPLLRNKNLIKGLLLGLIILTANEYARHTWDIPSRARLIALGLEERPYVYRALVPWLAHVLVILGVSPELALTIIVVVSAVALLYGIKYLFASSRS